jgi:hypothetical protein
MELSFFVLLVLMWIFWSCACYVKRKSRQNSAERQRRQHLASLELQRNEMRNEAVAYFIGQQSASLRAQISQVVDRKKLIENSLCVADVENEEEARNLISALSNGSVEDEGNVFTRAWVNTLDAARSFTLAKPECSICLSGYDQEEKLAWPKSHKCCNHVFHEECIKLWLKEHDDCPLCRRKILICDETDVENAPPSNSTTQPESSTPIPGTVF